MPKPKKPDSGGSQSVGFRVSPEYQDWLDDFAEFLGENEAPTASHLLQQALAMYAEKAGFRRPPPRKAPRGKD
jgi:hypothetical protein